MAQNRMQVPQDGKEYAVYYEYGESIPVSKQCSRCMEMRDLQETGPPIIHEIYDLRSRDRLLHSDSLWKVAAEAAIQQFQTEMRQAEVMAYVSDLEGCNPDDVDEGRIRFLIEKNYPPYVCSTCMCCMCT